jgi:hypothetical protein
MADFKVNGKDIDLPDMGTFSIDEAIVLYEYSGLTTRSRSRRSKVFIRASSAGSSTSPSHGPSPDRKAKEIEKAVRALNLLDLLTSIPDEEEAVRRRI